MKKILLVEDDARTAVIIEKGLRQENYSADHAADGEAGLQEIAANRYDAAIIDIMLPKLDGLSLIKAARSQGIHTPVIVLSAKDTVDDRVKGLQAGGDDYLIKPFAMSELVARLQALLRRSTVSNESTLLTVGDLRLDLIKHKVYRGEDEIELQPKEYALLEYLVRNAGRNISKNMIIENVWDYDFDPQTNIVEVRMCRLRDKIDGPYKHKLIRTHRGLGYVIEA